MGARAGAVAGFEAAQAVADAILYEGYLLYPYRRSSGKNRVRWQFGVLLPPVWARARGLVDAGVAGSAESWWQQTECLLREGADATVRCRVRFLQLQRKSVQERGPDGTYRPVDAIEAGSRRELGFDEAVAREFDVEAPVAELLPGVKRLDLSLPGGEDVEPLADDEGRLVGRVLRRRWPLRATVTVSASAAQVPADAAAEGGDTRSGLVRLRVRVENADDAALAEAARDVALRTSLLGTHVLIAVSGGSFVSLLDPPAWAERAARACSNVHVFPVLAGAEGEADVVLSAPIILYDHPRIAPESPGDLHDATEIDEILSLRTLTLTDAEKREARATDARAARIIDRVDALPSEAFARLHGATRSLGPTPGAGAPE
jgi:hypothetical protein